MRLRRAMMKMLLALTDTLTREGGSGWNLQKVHEVFFHLVHQICEVGRPANTDCQVGERGLKVWGKHDAKRTNKGNIHQFTEQTCKRMYETVLAQSQLAMDFV